MNHFTPLEKQIIDSFRNANANEKGIDVLSYVLEQLNSASGPADSPEIKIYIDTEYNIVNILFPFILVDSDTRRERCISHLLSIISIIKFLKENRYIYLSIQHENFSGTADNTYNIISFADKEMTDILSSKIYVTQSLCKFIDDKYRTPHQVTEHRNYRIIKWTLIVTILTLIATISSLIGIEFLKKAIFTIADLFKAPPILR